MAIRAPKHLSTRGKRLYREIAAEYGLDAEPHALEVLRLALEALDRCDDARRVIAAEGAIVTTRHGDRRPHPAIAIERDSRIAAMRAFRELSLDPDAASEPRLPRIATGALT